MKEAIIGLIGVFMGGAIGVAGQILLANFDSKKWKKEKKIEQLRIQKDNLEKKYDKFIPELHKGIAENNYGAGMLSDIMYTFPKNVEDKFDEFIQLKLKIKNNDDIKVRTSILRIHSAMKKSLNEIEEKIKAEIEK
jgi:gas vesicle protein